MLDMVVLFKDEMKKYNTSIYQNFNTLENETKKNEDDLFWDYTVDQKQIIPKGGKFKYLSVDETEEGFVKNYGNPFASPQLVKRTLVVEENESKIALKLYTYVSTREVNKKYFKVRRTIDYLTFNFKRKLFYSGFLSLKKKRKIGSRMAINKTDISTMDIIRKITYFTEENEIGQTKYIKKPINTFLDRIVERLQITKDIESNDLRRKFYHVFLEISGIKYPNAFEKFVSYYTPKKEIQKFGNNLVTWFMKKHELKGTKIRNLLSMYENVDIDPLIFSYRFFGVDLFNKINDKSFLTESKENIYIHNHFYDNIHPSNLSKKEIDNLISIINTTTVGEVLNSLFDHIKFKNQLKKYGEEVKIKAANYDDYVTEHSEWSALVQSYKTGDVKRNYGEDAYLIQKEIYSEDATYYPVLLTNTGEYEMESAHQHNCVRTYSEKAHSLIISLRKDSTNGSERATIEFQFRRNQLVIVQKLGKYNKGLTNEWITPINELNDFANYLYSKGMIKLPKMVKKYRNGKTISTFAYFKDEDEKTFNLVPIWDVETDNNPLQYYMPDYNIFEDNYLIDELP